MRIIDADELEKKVYDDLHYRAKIEDWEFDLVINYLDSAPTLSYKDLVPQGEWLWFGKRGIYGDMYACSECHAKYDGQSPFCPNCGARMKGAD